MFTEMFAMFIVLNCLINNVISDHKYFEYDSDCVRVCVLKQESCTIEEANKDEFEKTCYTDYNVCKTNASPYRVCLQRNEKPIGGIKIWNDYKERYYPSIPHHSTQLLLYAFTGLSFVGGLIIGIVTLKYGKVLFTLCSRRNDYEPIASTSEIYRTTTVPLQSEGENIET